MANVMKSFEALEAVKQTPIERPTFDFLQLNEVQLEIYNAILYGPKSVPHKRWKKFSQKKQEIISKNYFKAQYVINMWKQEMMIQKSDKILETFQPVIDKLFPELGDALRKTNKPSSNYHCTLTFQELKITRTMIVRKLFECGLLPKNFMEIESK